MGNSHGQQDDSWHDKEMTREDPIGLILLVLCFFGIIGNCLNILIFSRPTLKAVTYIYMMAISLADIIYQIAHIFFSLYIWKPTIFSKSYGATWFTSKLVYYLSTTSIDASNILTMMFTIERYIATCHYMNYKKLQNRNLAKIVCAIIYTISIVFHIPVYYNKTIQIHNHSFQTFYEIYDDDAYLISTGSQIYLWLRNILFRLLPLLIIIILSIRVMIAYKKLQKKRGSMHSSLPDLRGHVNRDSGSLQTSTPNLSQWRESTQSSISNLRPHSKGEHQLYVILIITIILFFFAAVSGCIASIVHVYSGTMNQRHFIIMIITHFFEKITYGFSFYIYCACMPRFRKIMKSTLSYPCKKLSPPSSDNSLTSNSRNKINS